MNPEKQTKAGQDEATPNVSEAEILKAKREIQNELIRRSAGENEDNILAWIKKASENFNTYIHFRTDLVILWRDGEHQEEVIQILQEAEKINFEIQ